jgi:hypothetical protein
MAYVLKIMTCSAIALLVCGLAIAYTPWYMLGAAHDVVLFLYLGAVTVALPGGSWWASAKLLGVL